MTDQGRTILIENNVTKGRSLIPMIENLMRNASEALNKVELFFHKSRAVKKEVSLFPDKKIRNRLDLISKRMVYSALVKLLRDSLH